MEMKQSGMYMARQMSYKDVTFEVVEASLTLKLVSILVVPLQIFQVPVHFSKSNARRQHS